MTTIQEYYQALGWDYSHTQAALKVTGRVEPPVYVITSPLAKLIHQIELFVEAQNHPLMIVTGPTGTGKTALKEHMINTYNQTDTIRSVVINNPQMYTPLQLMRTIARQVTNTTKIPKSFGDAYGILLDAIHTHDMQGITTLIWIDEGQHLSFDHIRLVRNLTDCNGCKAILIGTDYFSEKLFAWESTEVEDSKTLADRVGYHIATTKGWTVDEILAWIQQFVKWVRVSPTGINPFDESAANKLHVLTCGRPRAVVQTVKMALEDCAMQYNPLQGNPPRITDSLLYSAMQRALCSDDETADE